MTKAFIIAIDGTAASGKGTLSKALAKQIGFEYLDTGLLYRIAAYNLIKNKIDIADPHILLIPIRLLIILKPYILLLMKVLICMWMKLATLHRRLPHLPRSGSF